MSEWVPVWGYEEYYMVSKKGEVYTLPREVKRKDGIISLRKGGLKKQTPSKKGYMTIKVTNSFSEPKRLSVHRVVIQSFLKTTGDGLQINHIDGVKTNNELNNLEFVTLQQNIEHAKINNLMARGENVGCSVLNEEQVLWIRKNHIPKCRQNGTRAMARKFGVNHKTISLLIHKKTWSHI